MTEEQTKKYLNDRIWDKFVEWIYGQTIGIIDGKIDYYDHDVIRFADAYLEGKPTYFD